MKKTTLEILSMPVVVLSLPYFTCGWSCIVIVNLQFLMRCLQAKHRAPVHSQVPHHSIVYHWVTFSQVRSTSAEFYEKELYKKCTIIAITRERSINSWCNVHLMSYILPSILNLRCWFGFKWQHQFGNVPGCLCELCWPISDLTGCKNLRFNWIT